MAEQLKSEVTGSVWKIVAAVGDDIAPGDNIIIIESMKMEIPLVCEDGGKLLALHVKEGDSVAEGQVLADIG
jgi:acetyl-CoA carboxylase biotin carboxyl carrier protein